MIQDKIWAEWLRKMEGDEEGMELALTKLRDAVTRVTLAV